ncbi:hypothetical protein WJX73_008360 [Symbiochloris irregularis]|uniref:Uncharacterized protein n=1 Tax=Symbiochloris irregularis TaxID=706552 RepID=A0AAW1P823_9CHLO
MNFGDVLDVYLKTEERFQGELSELLSYADVVTVWVKGTENRPPPQGCEVRAPGPYPLPSLCIDVSAVRKIYVLKDQASPHPLPTVFLDQQVHAPDLVGAVFGQVLENPAVDVPLPAIGAGQQGALLPPPPAQVPPNLPVKSAAVNGHSSTSTNQDGPARSNGSSKHAGAQEGPSEPSKSSISFKEVVSAASSSGITALSNGFFWMLSGTHASAMAAAASQDAASQDLALCTWQGSATLASHRGAGASAGDRLFC